MEAVGLASGVAGLITLAIQVSGAIHDYSSAIKNKQKTIEELANEISTLSTALSAFKDFLSTEEAKNLKLEDDDVLTAAYKDCKKRIERIGQIFLETQSGGKVFRRAWNKVSWPFQQKEAILQIDNLRRFTQVFNFAVNMRNCTILAQTSSNVSLQLKQIHDQVIDQTKTMPEILREEMLKHSTQVLAQVKDILDLLPVLSQQTNDIQKMKASMQVAEEHEQHRLKGEILNWLIPDGGHSKHQDIQQKQAKDTCQWFLEDKDFVSWANADGGPREFLCVGGPGTGKTVLCSIVIDHLQRIHAEMNVVVIHYYCDFFAKSLQNSSNFVRSLLRQLIQASHGIPASVLEFYKKTSHAMQDSLWLQQLQNVLEKIVAAFDRCYLVLDAIDETDLKERKGIFEVLKSLRASKGHLRTLATARPHTPEIERQFPDVQPFEMGASDLDVYNFLQLKIEENPLSTEILDDSLRSEILSSLCGIAQGMFLLPALQIDHVLDQVTKGGARKALTNLSTTLPQVFASTIERINKFSRAKKALASQTLLWISYAGRPLSISELGHALAVQLEQDEFDGDDIPSLSTVIESCCGLVEPVGDPMDPRPRLITFVHLSLQEFLLNEDHGLFKEADAVIAKTCLKYLTFRSLHSKAHGNRKALLRTLADYPFLEYASLFWGVHASGLPIEAYRDMALKLFYDRDALFLTLRVRDARNPNDSAWEQTTQTLLDSGSGGISIAANFGLATLLQLLIKDGSTHDLNAKNIYGSTPLHECAITGSIETAKVLVANGADILSRNKGGATPFYLAVAFDRLDLCKILLEEGSEQVNIARNDGYTPLHKACDFGTPEMVTMLLGAGAKLNATNDAERCNSMTPLHLACRRGNLPAVHLLVHAGADLEARTKDGSSALDLAATSGYLEVAHYLIDNGAKLDGKSKGGWTPLHRAARAGQVEVARLLLESGANLLERDYRRCLPLTLAVKQGDLNCMNLFLEYRPTFALHQLQNKDIEGETAKLKAYSTSHYSIYKYLRDLEAKLLAASGTASAALDDETLPLTRAIEKGSLQEVVDLLTARPELLLMPDSLGQLPLHTAFLEEQLEIAADLLERGVPIDVRGYHGWTPLHIAAGMGSYRMVSLALQYNANIHAESQSNNNALHKAASSHSMPVILELLRCGADPFSRNDHLMTPLHITAHQNFMEAARELLKPQWHTSRSADISSEQLIFIKDKRKHIARWWAENSGHLALADFLKLEERKAKSDAKINNNNNNRLTSGNNSRRSTPRHSPNLSRTSTDFDTVSSFPLSRSTTRDSVSTRTTTTSLLLSPPLAGHMSRRSTSKVFYNDDDDGDDWSAGLPSPARTPTLPVDGLPTTLLRDESMQRRERRYAEFLLELESD